MILMYHKVSLEAPTVWWVEVDDFYRQLHALKNRKVVYLDDYDPGDPDQVVITFDGVYRNVLQYAAPLLKKYGYPFELFVTSDYIGGNNEFDSVEPLAEFSGMEDLASLTRMGGRLQWHSRSHTNLKEVRDPDIIARELDIPAELRKLDHGGFGWFAYPHGEFNEDVLAATRTRFRGAVSCIQGNDRDRHMLNRVTATNELNFNKIRTSVIIASYNYGAFLVEAIESVLRQTLPADEILISDDCSDDETWEIAMYYQAKFPDRIRVNRNENNLGIVDHFNKAVRLTTGGYVCILGADNRYRSDFLERTTALLDADERVAVAYTDFALFGPRAEIVAMDFKCPVRKIADTFYVVAFPDYDEISSKLLKKINFIHGSSIFRRKAFDAVNGYQNAFPMPEDYGLFRRMISSGWSAAHSAFPLLEYRQHSRGQANSIAVSAALLHNYRQRCISMRLELDELQGCMDRTRRSLAWKFAMPVRVLENLARKWGLSKKPNQ